MFITRAETVGVFDDFAGISWQTIPFAPFVFRACVVMPLRLGHFVQTTVIKKKLVLWILLPWDLRYAFVGNAVSLPQLRSPAFA